MNRICDADSSPAMVATRPVLTTRPGTGEGEARRRLEREIVGPYDAPAGERYEDVVRRLLGGV